METTIITTGTAALLTADLEAYHCLRHDIFVSLQGLGRTDLYAAAGQETDIWDLPHFQPVHFLVKHETRPVAVGRMTSAVRPTMMEVLYPQFLDKPIMRQPSLWEIQRVGVDTRLLDDIDRERAFLTLLLEMNAYAARTGVKELMLLTFEGIWKKRLAHMQRMGPVAEHLGVPHVALINALDSQKDDNRRAALARLENLKQKEKAA